MKNFNVRNSAFWLQPIATQRTRFPRPNQIPVTRVSKSPAEFRHPTSPPTRILEENNAENQHARVLESGNLERVNATIRTLKKLLNQIRCFFNLSSVNYSFPYHFLFLWSFLSQYSDFIIFKKKNDDKNLVFEKSRIFVGSKLTIEL